MEWFGLNLSNYRQREWVNTTTRNLWLLCFCITLSICLAFSLWVWAQNMQQTIQSVKKQREQQISILNKYQNKIDEMKKQQSDHFVQNSIEKTDIARLIIFIRNLPLNGGLEIIKLEHQEKLTLSVSGKLSSADFQQFEQQLKSERYSYKILHLQSSEQSQLEFQLHIIWEVMNETEIS